MFETQGDLAAAQRLARRRIVGEDDYQRVAKLIEASRRTSDPRSAKQRDPMAVKAIASATTGNGTNRRRALGNAVTLAWHEGVGRTLSFTS
jgi:hypothetical protein